MNALFVNPPWTRNGRFGVRAGSRWPHFVKNELNGPACHPYPFFMCHAVSYLKNKGYDVDYIDAIGERWTDEQFFNEVKKLNPKYIFIETSSPSWLEDVNYINKLKDKHTLIAVGHGATFEPQKVLGAGVNSVIKGEYELNSELILASGLTKQVYDFNQIQDINTLPFPLRRDKRTVKLYQNGPFGCRGTYSIYMWGSRGCPFRCKFCICPPFANYTYRPRSAENILAEIESVTTRFGTDGYLWFDDDTFTMGKERIIEFCKGITKYNIDWSVMGRLSPLDKETLEIMANSGMKGIVYGIETANQEMQYKISKNQKGI